MNPHPRTIAAGGLAAKALSQMVMACCRCWLGAGSDCYGFDGDTMLQSRCRTSLLNCFARRDLLGGGHGRAGLAQLRIAGGAIGGPWS